MPDYLWVRDESPARRAALAPLLLAEGPYRLGAWLHRVAVTTSLDALRSGRRGARALEAPAYKVEPADRASPEGEPAARELFERFERALTTLSPGQRTTFLLKHSGGMTLSQVAETLDVSLPTVKTQFARACLRLQHALRSFQPHDEGRS